MSQPTPSTKNNPPKDQWKSMLLGLLLIAGLALLVFGVYLAVNQQEYIVMALGLLCVSVPASALAVAGRDQDASVVGILRDQAELLHQINEHVLVSDQAKQIAFRQKDREALREAIVEDLRTEDYEGAMVLVNEMAETFGYREEAEVYRTKILEAQAHNREVQISSAVEKINMLIDKYQWDLASAETQRLARIHPDSFEVQELPGRIKDARAEHKRELEIEFSQAAERDDVDRAVELLKELDMYLSPAEAEAYTEMARGVIGKQKGNLGVKFKISVQDRDWIEAIKTGEQIIKEFPNSMFATEVRGMLDTLRQRAAGQRAAMVEK